MRIGFYGDDFTGSVDVLDTLVVQGVKAALFLEPPTRTILEKRFEGLEAVGVAGISRALKTEEMEAELRPAFEALKGLGPPVVHYKVCSTFDSSPEVGSIGRSVELGLEILGSKAAPLVLGTPHLKRFVAFGNLFASIGDETYRIDRHPMMSRHPITPMDEADVRLHLAKQTEVPVELIDTLALRGSKDALRERFRKLMEAPGRRVVAMDTIADAELPIVGGLIWEAAKEQQTLVVGSSGVEYCLASYWQSIGETKRLEEMPALESVDNLFVMCGSASPATQGQIEYAERKGFRSICIDAPALMDPEKADAAARRLEDEIIEILRRGESVVAYAAKGPEDPAIAETRAAAKSHGVENAGYRLARIQGRMTKRIIAEAGIRRACVAGGDTSGYVTKELGIFALQVAAIIAPGTPICNATSNNEAFDGFELALKSGQLGGEAYFEGVRMGRPG